MMIESKRGYPSISRQCELLGVSRSGHYRRICAQPSLRRRESERVKAKIEAERSERKEEKLYKKIGELSMDVEFLKKSCRKLGIELPCEYDD